jgi:cobalt/nickel transport system permease protein
MQHAGLRHVDPRCRLVTAVALASATALAARWATLGVALAAACGLAVLARVSWQTCVRRIASLNALLLVVVVLLPLTTPGESVGRLGPLSVSREGCLLAAMIVAKTNIIVLAAAALLGAMNAATVGHALEHLRVPDKLVHLVLLCARYVDTIEQEYRRLRAAMAARGFRARADRQTYRAFGYLVGMLLVRSLDRSERVLAAMRCRGFRGRFYLLDHFRFTRGDAAFLLAAAALLATMIGLEWR